MVDVKLIYIILYILIAVVVLTVVVGVYYIWSSKKERCKVFFEIVNVFGMLVIGIAVVLIALGVRYLKEEVIKPKLVLAPQKYEFHNKKLVFRILNDGKGNAYDLEVALEHESKKDGWKNPLRWYVVPLEEWSFKSIKPDSSYQIWIDLESGFASGDATERDRLLEEQTLGNFKVYMFYSDSIGTKYCCSALIMPGYHILPMLPQ
jgi:hypothetical protein